MKKKLRGMQIDVHRLLQSEDATKIKSIISKHKQTKQKRKQLDGWIQERYLPSMILHEIIKDCKTPDALDFIIPEKNSPSRHECDVYYQLVKHFGGDFDIVAQVRLCDLLAKDQISFGASNVTQITHKRGKNFQDEETDREYFEKATCDFVLYKRQTEEISNFELVIEYDGMTKTANYGGYLVTEDNPTPFHNNRMAKLARKQKYFEDAQKNERFIILNEAFLNDLNPNYTDETGYLSTVYLYLYLKQLSKQSSCAYELIQHKLPKYFTEENQEFVNEIADNPDYGIRIASGEFDIVNRRERTNRQFIKFVKKYRGKQFEGEINFAELSQIKFYMRNRFKTRNSTSDPRSLEVVTEVPNFLGIKICDEITDFLESTAIPMSDKVLRIIEQAAKISKSNFHFSPYECLLIEHQLRCMQYLSENREKLNLAPNYDEP